MTNNEWEKEFNDFYYESGKYKGRPLGEQEYVKFISTLLAQTRQDTVREVIEKIHTQRPKGEPYYHQSYNDGKMDVCDDLLFELRSEYDIKDK